MIKLFSAALLLSAGLNSAASAQDFTPDVHVSYRDLDFSRQADIKRLDRRIADAIAQVCSTNDGSDAFNRVAIQRCSNAKLAEIAAQRRHALEVARPSPIWKASAR